MVKVVRAMGVLLLLCRGHCPVFKVSMYVRKAVEEYDSSLTVELSCDISLIAEREVYFLISCTSRVHL